MQIILDIPDKTAAITVTTVEAYKVSVDMYSRSQLLNMLAHQEGPKQEKREDSSNDN